MLQRTRHFWFVILCFMGRSSRMQMPSLWLPPRERLCRRVCVCAAHPCDVCSPKVDDFTTDFLYIFKPFFSTQSCGWGVCRTYMYTSLFLHQVATLNPNGPNPTPSRTTRVCKTNQYSVLLFKFAVVLTEAEGHRRWGAASSCFCRCHCLLLPPAAKWRSTTTRLHR